MGKTEAMFNVIGWRFDDGPYQPCLYIGPTEKLAKSMSRDRISKMIRSTPTLYERLEKGMRDSITEKHLSGVRLGIAWAGSTSELAGHPAGLILLDERDRMSGDIGGEGDPMELATARTKNFLNSKIGVSSTPTVEDNSPIWSLLESGEMRFWAWTCIHCGEWFVPHIAILHWSNESTPDESAKTAVVGCPHCGGAHTDRDKPALNASGHYETFRKLADRESAEGAIFGKYVPTGERVDSVAIGFWISGLASPWMSFFDLARRLILAYASGAQGRIQGVINTYGGELYKLRGDAPPWEDVAARRGDFAPGSIPSGTIKIVLGADVQKFGIYYVIRAFGLNMESWLLDHGFIAGETEYDNVWVQFGNVIQAPLGDKRIDAAFIDSGYRPGDKHKRPDHAVYSFARRFPGVVFPTKGRESADTPIRLKLLDYSAGGVAIKGGVRLYLIDTDFFKRWIHGRINWPEDQSGAWHLHAETTEDYCRQIVAEEMISKPSGRHVWVKTSADNHYFDCEVGATAAAYYLGVPKLRARPKEDDKTPKNAAPRQQSRNANPLRRKSLF